MHVGFARLASLRVAILYFAGEVAPMKVLWKRPVVSTAIFAGGVAGTK